MIYIISYKDFRKLFKEDDITRLCPVLWWEDYENEMFVLIGSVGTLTVKTKISKDQIPKPIQDFIGVDLRQYTRVLDSEKELNYTMPLPRSEEL